MSTHASRYRRLRRRRAICRAAGLTLAVCLTVGGISFVVNRQNSVPSAPSASVLSDSAASSVPEVPAASSEAVTSNAAPASSAAAEAENSLLTAEQAQAILNDPRMVLVNGTYPVPDGYAVTTKECGSSTAINKTLQTDAANAFLQMQAAAAKDGVDIQMQSGYRSVGYQTQLFNDKVNEFLQQGCSEAEAREKASVVVEPPTHSEYETGLAADLNSPEHPDLDEGFENTAAFRWLCQHAGEYGFILRYTREAEEVTKFTYEPWHWRYVGPENAALINQYNLCLEDAVAALQKVAAGQPITG